LIIAYAYYETGQEEEARNHVAQALEINPQLSVEALRGRIPFKDQGLPEAITDALRKTGLN
jgi:tetratricopeptide (TPR) repeat protein